MYFSKQNNTRKKKVKEPEIILDDSPFAFGPENQEVFVSPNAEGLDASIERPGDYLKPEEAPVVVEPERPREAAPGRNRGVITGNNTQEIGQRIKIAPDDLTNLGKASHSDFGNVFPENPNKGDVYLRTDYLPNRLFRFNGSSWVFVESNVRTTLTNKPLNGAPAADAQTRHTQVGSFINNNNTATINGVVVEERQALSKALKAKPDKL